MRVMKWIVWLLGLLIIGVLIIIIPETRNPYGDWLFAVILGTIWTLFLELITNRG